VGGSAGGTVRQTIVALPTLRLGAYSLAQVPLFINEQDPAGGAVAENIGSALLRRFTMFLDFIGGPRLPQAEPVCYGPAHPRHGVAWRGRHDLTCRMGK
jgi:hypothetical protein